MPAVKLRITASVEASTMKGAFAPLVKAAGEARNQIKAILSGIDGDLSRLGRAFGGGGSGGLGRGTGAGGGRSLGSPLVSGPVREQQKTYAQIEKDAEKHARQMERIADRQKRREELDRKSDERDAERRARAEERAATRAANARERENQAILRQSARDDVATDRANAKAQREAKRASDKAQADREDVGRRRYGSFVSGAGAVASRGVGFAADIARGAGVDFSVASGVKKRVDIEARAIGLANAGYIEGQAGPAGQKQSARAIMGELQATGQKYGIGQDTIAEGLDAFVGKTGDLATGRAMMDAFAKTAKATGAEFNDVAAAAGAISNKLGEVGEGKAFKTAEDKAKAIQQVMLAIAGQGKVGAVEIKDMATQMEKLTSQASKFQSNGALKSVVGTDTGANIAMLGVLAQAARQTEKGTAAQATQSSMAFIRDLTNQTALKRIGASTIYADKGRTMIRDPQEVIKDLISRTKGDVSKLAYLLPNQNSRAAVNAFMDPYMDAYKKTKGTEKQKDAAGRAAVDAKFADLKAATLSDTSLNSALNEALGSTATKAEQFQQKLDQVTGEMADKLIPALLKLAPAALKTTESFAKGIAWLGERASGPGMVGGAVVGAGVAKVVADSVASAMGAKLAAAMGGGLGAAMIGTLAIASVGMMTIDKLAGDDTKREQRAFKDEADATNAATRLGRANEAAERSKRLNGFVTPEVEAERIAAQEEADKAQAEMERKKATGEAIRGEGKTERALKDWQALGNSALMGIGLDTRLGDGKTFGERREEYLNAQKLDSINAVLGEIRGAFAGTLRVMVTNPQGGGAPTLPTGGQTGPGG